MSTQAKIHCYTCGKDYYVYQLGISKDGFCPHCATSIDPEMWRRVIDAVHTANDINQHFHKYAMEREEPRFSISINYCDIEQA